jgi:hypothetical protein
MLPLLFARSLDTLLISTLPVLPEGLNQAKKNVARPKVWVLHPRPKVEVKATDFFIEIA